MLRCGAHGVVVLRARHRRIVEDGSSALAARSGRPALSGVHAFDQRCQQSVRRSHPVCRCLRAGQPRGSLRLGRPQRRRQVDPAGADPRHRRARHGRHRAAAGGDGRIPAPGKRASRRRDGPGTGHSRQPGDRTAAPPAARARGRARRGHCRLSRGAISLRPTGRLHVGSQGQENAGGTRLSTDGLRPSGAGSERGLGHAGLPGAAPHPGAGSAAAGRADQSPRPGSLALVPGLPARLSGRDVADFARSRVPQPIGHLDSRDSPGAPISLSRQLRRIPRTAFGQRSAVVGRVEAPAARDRPVAGVCRSVPRQEHQGGSSAEQGEADRADGADRGPRRVPRPRSVLPFPSRRAAGSAW